jgi:hypothetical protein
MRALSMRIVTYLIEYLGEFEFIFETILDYESGTRWVLLMQKNRHRKSHAWPPLRFSKFFFWRDVIFLQKAQQELDDIFKVVELSLGGNSPLHTYYGKK